MSKHRPGYHLEYTKKNRLQVRANANASKLRRVTEGKCKHCATLRLETSKRFCRKHWFINVACNRLGTATVEAGAFLADLYEQQLGKCFYTGWPLTLGVDAELDHTLAVKTHPALEHDFDNVRWVHKYVNKMKRDIPVDKFIEVCHAVAKSSCPESSGLKGTYARGHRGRPTGDSSPAATVVETRTKTEAPPSAHA